MELVDNTNYALKMVRKSRNKIMWDIFSKSSNNLIKKTIPDNLKTSSVRECERLTKIIAKNQTHREAREAIWTYAGWDYEDEPHIKWLKFKLEHIWTPISKGEFIDADKFDEIKPLIQAWQKECEETEGVSPCGCIEEGNSLICVFLKHSEYKKICCFEGCDNKYGSIGHNPRPFRFPEGSRCCEECNECVFARRMAIDSGIKTPQGLYRKLFQGFSIACDNFEEQKATCEQLLSEVMKSDEEIKATNEKVKEINEKIKEGKNYKKLYEKEAREHKKLLKKQNKMLEDAMKNERAEFKKMKCDMERKIADLRRKLKNKHR